jgi:putative colanic acid biosynthesis glycosyltransferase
MDSNDRMVAQQRRVDNRCVAGGSISPNPLVSIIIPVWNAVRTLRATLESVIRQTEIQKLELIVIDGGSTDGTAEILSEYNKHIAFWSSGPDAGLYDAMNKGVGESRGEWIFFLGADDVLASPLVIREMFTDVPQGTELLIGNVQFDNGRIFKSHLSFKTNIINSIHHQAAFYRKNLFSEFKYDTKLSIIADYELNYRIYKEQRRYQYKQCVVSICATTGVSHRTSEWKNYKQGFAMRARYTNVISNGIFFTMGMLNVLRRKVFGWR